MAAGTRPTQSPRERPANGVERFQKLSSAHGRLSPLVTPEIKATSSGSVDRTIGQEPDLSGDIENTSRVKVPLTISSGAVGDGDQATNIPILSAGLGQVEQTYTGGMA